MQCRTCGAEIFFVKLQSGKTMPVNAEPVSVLIRENGYPFFRKGGQMVRGFRIGDAWDDDPDANVIDAHESHFTSCNEAVSWRKRKSREKHDGKNET